MAKENTSFEEKRSSTRFPINSKVKVSGAKISKPFMGVCCNISGSGLLIRCPRKLDVDSTVTLEISEGKIEFKSEALVVRSVEDEDNYLIAVKVQEHLV